MEEIHIKISEPGRKEEPNREDEAHNGTISSPERKLHHGDLEVGTRNGNATTNGKMAMIMDQQKDGIARTGMTVRIPRRRSEVGPSQVQVK